MSKKELSHAEANAVAGLASIKEMIAALECDYDRLEELRDLRDSYDPEEGESDSWHAEYSSQAEELAELEDVAGDCSNRDDAQLRIDDDPLSIEVRSDWHSIGGDSEDAEYCILLTTGGPAMRIIGELSDGQPYSARIEYQDWGTPWAELITTGDDNAALLRYVRAFCWEH